MNSEKDIAELRAELVRAQEAIEKLLQRVVQLEQCLPEVPQPDGAVERRVVCQSVTVHPAGQPTGMRWELSATEAGATLVLHSGAGEELLQIADTPDGRGPLITMFSHDGTQTVQLGAGTNGGGVVRVANEEGTGLVLLTTDGDAGRVGVAHAKTKALVAMHTQGGQAGVEVQDANSQPVAVVQSGPTGGVMGVRDSQGHERVLLGMNSEGATVVLVKPPERGDGIVLFAGAENRAVVLHGTTPTADQLMLTTGERDATVDFWSHGRSLLHLGTCGAEDAAGIRGAQLRLSGTNQRDIELNPLEPGRQFALLGDERLPLVTLGASEEGVEFVLNDDIGMPRLQLFARDAGGVIFAHDSENTVAATLPDDVEFDQDGEED